MLDLVTAASAIQESTADSMPPLFTFLWAAGGSFALEIVSLYNKIRAVGPAELPGYYKSPVFWMVRLMITVIAGMLAIAEKAGNPLLAINIGAAAPAILQALETPPRSSVGGGNA